MKACCTLISTPFSQSVALRGPGITTVVTAQRSYLVKYALMGISFFLCIWVGTFMLMV